MSTTSAASKLLLEAARTDAPPPDVHDAVWQRIAEVTLAPAVAAPAAPAASGAIAKYIALGALLGAGAVSLVVVDLEPRGHPPPAFVRRVAVARASAEERPVSLASSVRGRAAAPSADRFAVATPAASVPALEESVLASEAHLVSEARGALRRGKAERALALVAATHGLSVRRLEPEELGIEIRALRAAGRPDEAFSKELELRRRFPDHPLAR